MFEIEVKAKANDPAALEQKMRELGVELSSPVRQYDRIYTKTGTYPKNKNVGCVLRIREENDKIFLTSKVNRSNELDCIEFEVVIDNAKQMAGMIDLLGYKLTVEIKKTRRKAKYQNYEICLDQVEGLGNFIEVEKMSDEPAEKVQEELFSFLQNLGVERADQVLNGYDTLMLKKLGTIGLGA